jgi:hypothetical protein
VHRLLEYAKVVGVFVLMGGMLLGLAIIGEGFQKHTIGFAILWLSAPVFGWRLNQPKFSALFTVAGVRFFRGLLMTIVVAISFMMFFGGYQLRDKVGRSFVEGYRHWRAEPVELDTDDTYYPGDHWTARNASGRFAMEALEWTVLIAVFTLPWITNLLTQRAVSKREKNLVYKENKRFEVHEVSW